MGTHSTDTFATTLLQMLASEITSVIRIQMAAEANMDFYKCENVNSPRAHYSTYTCEQNCDGTASTLRSMFQFTCVGTNSQRSKTMNTIDQSLLRCWDRVGEACIYVWLSFSLSLSLSISLSLSLPIALSLCIYIHTHTYIHENTLHIQVMSDIYI